MEETRPIPSLIKITSALLIVMLSLIHPLSIWGIAMDTKFPIGNVHESPVKKELPESLTAALSLAYGNYGSLINQDDLLRDLQEVDIVLIGEAHADQRDMQTAFEITRQLAQRRRIALAVERFPLALQPGLSALNDIDNIEKREDAMRRILQTDDYRTVWKPDTFNSPYLNFPSADAFEDIVMWAARARIPIIGLDLPVSERELGLGEDMAYRNELWKNQIVRFLDKKQTENYLVVAIGGIDHFSNAPDSVQAKLRQDPSPYLFLSIGQRDANYSENRSLQVEDLALRYQIDDLILQTPQFAVVLKNGAAIFPSPPDYWLAVYSTDNRGKMLGKNSNRLAMKSSA